MNEKERFVEQMYQMGYPREYGLALLEILRTENMRQRMLAYLHSARPSSLEIMADEAVAIAEDNARWRAKKIGEYANK